ncbi:DUF4386 domain-containing protein [Rhodanobacter sp. B2A1Ga4]|uniref:DUF4386 domain-containing protein n=1 Tax=Rhodanobacter sp. B2A1Ga4 TaxID=2778647 RepID=UPI001B3869CB|nr:DUF4386 domain-containing protein [Rhodanobacter sp. B2A1Ga4]MBQ4853447.1 DUF4386 domain-containing protein [Rhodanobacter sp. B2A1Ga4]
MSTVTESAAQMRYARIAGFVYLLLIVLFMGGQLLIGHVTGSGTFAERTVRIVAELPLYRAALVLQFLASVFTVLLAYSLYVVLKSVDEHIARLALYFRLGEAFGGLTAIVAFAALALRTEPEFAQSLGATQMKALVDLAQAADFASFNIGIVFFSFGSTLFYRLFLRTPYLPRVLSAFGMFASALTFVVAVTSLVMPAWGDALQVGWVPIFIAEIVTGILLMVRGAQSAQAAAIAR